MAQSEWHRLPLDGTGPNMKDLLGWGKAWFWSQGNARNGRPHLRWTNPMFENVSDCTHFMLGDHSNPPQPPTNNSEE